MPLNVRKILSSGKKKKYLHTYIHLVKDWCKSYIKMGGRVERSI